MKKLKKFFGGLLLLSLGAPLFAGAISLFSESTSCVEAEGSTLTYTFQNNDWTSGEGTFDLSNGDTLKIENRRGTQDLMEIKFNGELATSILDDADYSFNVKGDDFEVNLFNEGGTPSVNITGHLPLEGTASISVANSKPLFVGETINLAFQLSDYNDVEMNARSVLADSTEAFFYYDIYKDGEFLVRPNDKTYVIKPEDYGSTLQLRVYDSYNYFAEEVVSTITGTVGGYTITYDGNADGVTNLPVDSKGYYTNYKLELSEQTPCRTGYVFKGWSLTKGSNDVVSSCTFASSNITVYAVWSENYGTHTCHDITFNNPISSDFKCSDLVDGQSYYLTSDVALDFVLNVSDNSIVNICLCGHVFDLTDDKFLVNGNATLNLYDCSNTKRYYEKEGDVYSLTAEETDGVIYGGAIMNSRNSAVTVATYTANLNCYDIDFVNNYSTDGGAICNDGTANFYGCSFIGNRTIQLSPGMPSYGGAIKDRGMLLVKDCTFKYNSASYGGAICVNNYTLTSNLKAFVTIINCTIENNYASEDGKGGGVYIFSNAECFSEGTQILMADGSLKNIEDIKEGEEIKTFDHNTGTLSSEKVSLAYMGGLSSSLKLTFDDQTTLNIVGCHDLFEKESLKYVTISVDNVISYIGKYFYNAVSASWVKLIDASYITEETKYYSIYTAHDLNCIANGMLTLPDDADFALNIFEFDENLIINADKAQEDIKEYGLTPYSLVSDLMSEEQYDNFNIKYCRIAIAKGLITLEDLTALNKSSTEYIDSQNKTHFIEPLMTLKSGSPAPITASTYAISPTENTGYIVLGSNTKITNNYKGTDTISNLYVNSNDNYIYVIEGSTGINVGVTFDSDRTSKVVCDTLVSKVENKSISSINGYFVNTNDEDYLFTSDDDAYGVRAVKSDTTPATYSLELKDTYSVTFDLNFTTTATAPEDTNKYCVGDVITLPTLTGVTNGDLTFCGWNTSKTSKDYKTGNYTILDADVIDSGIKFYAIWLHKCNDTVFKTVLDDGDILMTGTYYLEDDVTLTDNIQIAEDQEVSICLNGHILDLNGYKIINNGTLNIFDCDTTKTYFKYQDGNLIESDTPTGIYMEGGYITGDGCIENIGEYTVNLTDVSFYNCNFATNYCGIINNDGGTLSIDGCYFIKCEAKNSGYGGAINSSNGSTTVKNSSFYGCKAESDGGAIYLDEGIQAAIISDCVFKYCYSGGRGGAIYLTYSENCEANISDCVISNCECDDYGGAICNDDGSTLILTDCVIKDNISGNEGGGLEIMGDALIIDCTITGNIAENGAAGIDYTCGTLIFGGKTIVYNNLVDDEQNNLFIYNGNCILIDEDDPLEVDSKIGITLSNSHVGYFMDTCSTDAYTDMFISDALEDDISVIAIDEETIPANYYYMLGHTCEDIIYNIEIDSSFTGGALVSGNYFLSEDIVITESITIGIAAKVNICLNGHSISPNYDGVLYPYSIFKLDNFVNLTITDCKEDSIHLFDYDENATDENMFAVMSKTGEHEVKGGLITGAKSYIFEIVQDTSVFDFKLTLKNITIIGNTAGYLGFIKSDYNLGYLSYYNFDNVKVIRNKMICGAGMTEHDGKSLFTFGAPSYVKISNSQFEYNYLNASQSMQGLITLHTSDGNSLTNVSISHNTINSSTSKGALVFCDFNSSTSDIDEIQKAVKFESCFFNDNRIHVTDLLQGLIRLDYIKTFLYVTDCEFNNNAITTYLNNKARVDGGIFSVNGMLVLEDSEINENKITVRSSILDQEKGHVGLIINASYYSPVMIKDVTAKKNSIALYCAGLDGTNSGLFICTGRCVTIDNLQFTENTITNDEYYFGTGLTGSSDFAGGFIYASSIGQEYNSSTYTIINSNFDNNSLVSLGVASNNDSKSNKITGGVAYFLCDAILRNVSFDGNTIKHGLKIDGGIIYANGTLTISPGITQQGSEIVYERSSVSGNTIVSLNQGMFTGMLGGLIRANHIAYFDRIDFNENKITNSGNSYCYGALVNCDASVSNDRMNFSKCSFNENIIDTYGLNGLLLGHTQLLDSEFNSNTFTASAYNGAILHSHENFGGDEYITNTTIDSNIFENKTTSSNVFGLLFNFVKGTILFDNVTISNNKMKDGTNDFATLCGFVTNIKNNNVEVTFNNVTVTSNNIKAKSLFGGLSYNSNGLDRLDTITFTDNTFTCDFLYGGFTNSKGGYYRDLTIENNIFNVLKGNQANFFYQTSSDCFYSFGGDISCEDNTFSKEYADIVCDDDSFDQYIIMLLVDDEITSFSPLTYSFETLVDTQVILSDNTCYLTEGYFLLYKDYYFIDTLYSESHEHDCLYIKNRIISEPSEDNDYEFVLDSTGTTFTYKWFVVKTTGEVELTQTTSKLDYSTFLYGKFYCTATTTDGFEYICKTFEIKPKIISNPTEDNGCIIEFDDDLIDSNDVEVTYEWLKVDETSEPFVKAIDDSEASISELDEFDLCINDEEPLPISLDGSYNSATKWWNVPDNKGLIIDNIVLKSNESLMVYTKPHDAENALYAFIYIFYDCDGSTYDQEKLIFNEMFSPTNGFKIPYKYPYGTSEGHTDGEDITVSVLLVVFSEDSQIGFDAFLGKINNEGDLSYIDEDNLIVYSDGLDSNQSDYDSETNTVAQTITQDVEGLFFGMHLNKDDYVVFNYDQATREALSSLDSYSMFYILKYDKAMTSFSEIDNVTFYIMNEGISSPLGGFYADETAYYYAYIMIYGEDEQLVPCSLTVSVSQSVKYISVEDMDTNELKGVDSGEYVARAKFTSEFGTVSVSCPTTFVARTITYNTNGFDIDIPEDEYNYKNAQKTTILGDEEDLVVTNKKFVGWNTQANGLGTKYDIGDQMTFGKASITLYAIFEDKTAISITTSQQASTYSGSSKTFTVSGNATADYSVEYKVNSVWTANAPSDAGTYDVKVTREEDSTYASFEQIVTGGLKINKLGVNEPIVNGSYVFTGSSQTVSLSGVESYMSTSDSLSKTNADTYSITYVLDNNHDWNTGNDGVVYWTISKANAVITVDQTAIVKTYGETVTIPTATSNFGTVSCDKVSNNLVNAGTYTITYTVDGTANYNGNTKTVSVTINKANYAMNDAKWNYTTAFTYDKSQKTVSVTGLPNGVTVKDYSNNSKTDAGDYTASVTFNYDSANYNEPTLANLNWTINKANYVMSNAKWNYTTAFTYDKSQKTVLVTGLPNGVTVKDYSNNAKTDAGDYTASVTFNYDSANYNEPTLANLNWKINKGNAVITVDQTAIVKTYGQAVTVPTATSNFGSVSCDKVATNLVNAGSYTITYKVDATANYNGDTKTVNVTINKAKVVEPTVTGNYVDNGASITVTLNGVENFMTTSDSLSQTGAGVYTIRYTLDSNHEWDENNDGIITWEIKKPIISSEDSSGSISFDEGFAHNYSISIEITKEDEIESATNLFDYANIENDEFALQNNEAVSFVYKVKLLVGETAQLELNKTVKVKLLMPEDIDLDKLTRIIHVDSEGNIQVYKFDKNLLDANGYYEIETDTLNEFAFVYEQSSAVVWIIIGGSILFLFILFVLMFAIWKLEYDNCETEEELNNRKLKCLDFVYKPINKLFYERKKQDVIAE